MANLLPPVFIALAALALVLTLFWLWQSLRLALVHSLGAAPAPVVSAERATLLAEKQALLLALKDLENERESGKLSNADFDELNAQYRTRAREVLRALDAQLAPHRVDAKALLSGVGSRSSQAKPTSSAQPTAVAAPAFTSTSTPATTSADGDTACKACGSKNDQDAVFCKKCGTRMRAESEA